MGPIWLRVISQLSAELSTSETGLGAAEEAASPLESRRVTVRSGGITSGLTESVEMGGDAVVVVSSDFFGWQFTKIKPSTIRIGNLFIVRQWLERTHLPYLTNLYRVGFYQMQ